MPRMSLALVLLSAMIAVVLWIMATVVEMHLRQKDVLQDEISGPVDQAQPEGSAADTAMAMSCQETEARLEETVHKARFCTTDEDCTLFDYGYPIDCMTSVAKAQVPLLRQEYKRYDETCEHRVFFDCPTEPYVRLALCRNNRCIVELASNEALENATLNHIGKPER